MKVLTITGTRPELIRLSVIINKLDQLCTHILVYSNQNYDPNLKDVFFKELGIRDPDYVLMDRESVGKIYDFLAIGIQALGAIIEKEKPDKVLVLGDTNTSLISIIAGKMGIPVYHMEAGNRSFDKEVPEEYNRKIIDSLSTVNLPYTQNSYDNLIREGCHKNFVFKTGNPLFEVLEHYESQINRAVNYKDKYCLVTLHRSENVDNKDRAKGIIEAVEEISKGCRVIFPIHPRTKDRFSRHKLIIHPNIELIDPEGYFGFIHLLKHAQCVLTDSGSVPEETTIFHVPCVIMRNYIERQELIENGSVILAGTRTEDIVQSFFKAMTMETCWDDLPDYYKKNVSDTVIQILLGK